jgi:predicted transcriptional regulator of viral defense system
MLAKDFIKKQLGIGRLSFSIQEIEKADDSGHPSHKAILTALERLARKKEVISLSQGFYIIIPSEFSLSGCLPPDQVIVLLMAHWRIHYYVSLLSAAQYYGVGHQQPQIFQIMLEKNRAPLSCGRGKIVFTARKNLAILPTKNFKTPRGPIQVATPEVIALDLITYPQQCGGLNHIATLLEELAEHIQIEPLIQLAKLIPETAWIQRLGYLFSLMGKDTIAAALEKCLQGRNYYFKPLDTQKPLKGFIRDKKWKLILNSTIETDL